jgi:ethanolamine utilization cobalamin adenosyltransferase
LYIPIRHVEDIEVAVKILIEEAVEKATEELEDEYEEKLLEKDEEILELRGTIRSLENEIVLLQRELMRD